MIVTKKCNLKIKPVKVGPEDRIATENQQR